MLRKSSLADSAFIRAMLMGNKGMVNGTILINQEQVESLNREADTSLILIGAWILRSRWASYASKFISLMR
jgi:hypothetical protein